MPHGFFSADTIHHSTWLSCFNDQDGEQMIYCHVHEDLSGFIHVSYFRVATVGSWSTCGDGTPVDIHVTTCHLDAENVSMNWLPQDVVRSPAIFLWLLYMVSLCFVGCVRPSFVGSQGRACFPRFQSQGPIQCRCRSSWWPEILILLGMMWPQWS